jgi:multiple sugar transport system ATP-binding protein
VRQAKVCLFDEPFRNLAPTAAKRGRAAIAELRQRSAATIVYATTDPAEALALAGRTVVIEGGVVQQDGNAGAIFGEPANAFVAQFLGEPPMNLVHGTLKRERERVIFAEQGDGTIALGLPPTRFSAANEHVGQAVVLGFRPEAVEIARSANEGNAAGASFRALVERIELRGSETDLYLQTGSHELVCRSRRWALEERGGHRFQFEVELEKTYFFDASSGERLPLHG